MFDWDRAVHTQPAGAWQGGGGAEVDACAGALIKCDCQGVSCNIVRFFMFFSLLFQQFLVLLFQSFNFRI